MSIELDAHTILLTIAGSHAHGTAGEGSDLDVRGICIAPMSSRLSPFRSFEQAEGALSAGLQGELDAHVAARPRLSLSAAQKTEAVVYDLAKLAVMLVAQNPNALEILFAEPDDWVRAAPAWRRLHGERHRFLDRRVQHTYAGYAKAQLHKIRTHRGWLLTPPLAPPRRGDFGLPEERVLSRDASARLDRAIEERLASFGHDDLEMPTASRIALRERTQALMAAVLGAEMSAVPERLQTIAAETLQLPDAVLVTLIAERRYRAALRGYHGYLEHQRQRNPARAALEARFGYDTKHAMHLVRLYRTGIELLRAGELRVRRDDAEELTAIRAGALSYEGLLALASQLDEQLAAAATASQLPTSIDRDAIEALIVELIMAGAAA